MAQTVIGIFDNANDAQNAVQQLVSHGFSRSAVDVSTHSADNSTSGSTSYNDHDNDSFGESVSNFFGSLFGGNNDESDRYARVGRRSSIVTVHAATSDEAERAADILDEYGAVDVDERDAQYRSNLSDASTMNVSRSDVNTTDLNTTDLNTTDVTTNDTTNAIPIIEEELHVGKRVVQTGGARLRSRIIERPVEESVRLRVERVRVERHAVNRPATQADLNNFKEGDIEMTERAEVPVVGKEARVVEEVNLSKDVEEREETIRDTVRRTDVDVENLDNTTTTRRTTNTTDEDLDNLRSRDTSL